MWFKLILLITVAILMILVKAGGKSPLSPVFASRKLITLTNFLLVGEDLQDASSNETMRHIVPRRENGMIYTSQKSFFTHPAYKYRLRQ